MFNLRLHLRNSKIIYPVRIYCQSEKLVPKGSIQRIDEEKRDIEIYRRPSRTPFHLNVWNEFSQIRKERRKANSFTLSIKGPHDMIQVFQNIKNFPLTLTELYYYLKRRRYKKTLLEQQYLPQRVAILRPDLAAAHFLVRRYGSVKFVGQPNWIGYREKNLKLPLTYVPGMFLEGIKAERTGLMFEGLRNLEKLRHLKYLSLKNLNTINDWCLDWISKEYYLNLKHLDISGCKNVTHKGLSCFYRFECLETLEVGEISDTPEFKLGCLMLLDIMPKLNITGIDLNIPTTIDPVHAEEVKHIQAS